MRHVVLDTETTGLEASAGHRIIEIGCIEISNRRITERTWHHYLHPDRAIDEGAMRVHGISLEDLEDKPRFAELAEEFLNFVRGAELIIHNAPFDVGFLDSELARLESGSTIGDHCTILDTLALARSKHPGQRNSLDALCQRYEVDNSDRSVHGALLDARLLADVYLRMTGGQVGLALAAEESGATGGVGRSGQGSGIDRAGLDLRVIPADADELTAHRERLETIEEASGEPAVWTQLELD